MKTTLSILKADIGSIGGHLCPSQQLIQRVKDFVADNRKGLISELEYGGIVKKMDKLSPRFKVRG